MISPAPHSQRTLVAAMSGGVDSSVAAYLLHKQGWKVIGMTLQLWGKEECSTAGSRLCCSVRDSLDARAVARQFGFPHHVLKLEKVFKREVIDAFVEAYRHGFTPNPCITCNSHIKFGEMWQHARDLGAEAIATGHYARVRFDEERGRWLLLRSADPNKDQSYMLFSLTQEQLARTRFPLGELDKTQVRAIAAEAGLRTAAKPDSQDICFVRDRNKDNFLNDRLHDVQTPGPIEDVNGAVLGTHSGLAGYTIGQREGLGIATGKPLYVVRLDLHTNRLIVGGKQDLLQHSFRVEGLNWISIGAPSEPLRAWVKIRSRHAPAPAVITAGEHGSAWVACDEPQSAVTPGQAAVFYRDDEVLGGGWIAKGGDERRFESAATSDGLRAPRRATV